MFDLKPPRYISTLPSASFPRCPRLVRFTLNCGRDAASPRMVERAQKLPYAVQQTASLFDQLVAMGC